MFDLKMSGILDEDAKMVHDAIISLEAMVETLQREVLIRDGDKKPASELFILINYLKRAVVIMEEQSKKIMRKADIDHYGPLSEYIRPYLSFKKNE